MNKDAHPQLVTSFELHPDNPLRPPDWRWRLAEGPVEPHLRRRADRACDPWAGRVAAYRRDQGLVSGTRRHGPAATDPALAAAIRIRESPRLRLEVEARLLARQGYAEVAARCGLGTDAVEAYERAFFAVADRLDASDYIEVVVVGTSWLGGVPDQNEVTRRVAYRGGPIMLEAVLLATGGLWDPSAVPVIEPTPGLLRRACMLLAALALRVDRASAPAAVALQETLAEIDRRDREETALAASSHLRVDASFAAGIFRSGARVLAPTTGPTPGGPQPLLDMGPFLRARPLVVDDAGALRATG